MNEGFPLSLPKQSGEKGRELNRKRNSNPDGKTPFSRTHDNKQGRMRHFGDTKKEIRQASFQKSVKTRENGAHLKGY